MHFIHATALVVREAGLLIRGHSASGKSSLAAWLCEEARRDGLFARIVGDDRIALQNLNGRVVATPHLAIAGSIERRLLGVRSVAFEAACVIRLVVDLDAATPPRLPSEDQETVTIEGVTLARLTLPERPHDAARHLIFEWVNTIFWAKP